MLPSTDHPRMTNRKAALTAEHPKHEHGCKLVRRHLDCVNSMKRSLVQVSRGLAMVVPNVLAHDISFRVEARPARVKFSIFKTTCLIALPQPLCMYSKEFLDSQLEVLVKQPVVLSGLHVI